MGELPIPVAALSKAWVCGPSLLRLWVRILPGRGACIVRIAYLVWWLGYKLDDPGFESRRWRDILFLLQVVQTAVVSTQASVRWVLGFFHRVKRPERIMLTTLLRPPHAVMARSEKTLPFLPHIAQSTHCSLAILDPKYKQQSQHDCTLCWMRWNIFTMCIFCSRHVFVKLVSNPIQTILAGIFDFEIY